MSNQTAESIFNALGEPARRRILEVLRDGELPVGELADRLPVGRPAVSKHLRVLEGAGLVDHRNVGTRNLYALVPGALTTAQMWLVQTWDIALGGFAADVRATVASGPSADTSAPSAPVRMTGAPGVSRRTRRPSRRAR